MAPRFGLRDLGGRGDATHEQSGRASSLPLNTLCQPSFWEDPEWREVGRRLALPQDEGWLHRKAFEWTHCVYGLERLGALRPDARVLGVAAGHECVLYWLANCTRFVVATDLYRGGFAESLASEADPTFLQDPDRYAPFHYKRSHLSPLPADALRLPFADDSFDVVYSLSSIEHFGGHDKSAESMREMARVLRPGGTLCVATEFVLDGGPHPEYFTSEDLRHWVVGASEDLKLVEPLDETPPPRAHIDDPVRLPDDALRTPHVVLAIDQWRFTSVILFFRKKSLGDVMWSRLRQNVKLRATAARQRFAARQKRS